MLCGIATDQINVIGRKNFTLIRNIEIESLIFVDDIMFPTSRKEGIEKAIGNCRSMEKLKKFTFNNHPEKSAILKIAKGKSKGTQHFKTQVKRGEISTTKAYKYLGEWYSQDGTKEENLKKRSSKVKVLLREILKYGDERKVGEMAIEVRQKIYETVVVSTLFANIETWSEINEKDSKELEKMQYQILRGMFELPQCTPYWGIIAESGIWPVKYKIEYKKVMLFQNIIQSDEKRLIKEIVEDQIRDPYGKCWVKGIIEICSKYNISIQEVRNMSKMALKKEIKIRINDCVEKEIEEKKKVMKKLRFIEGFNKNQYLKTLGTKDAITILKTRLNMLDIKANFRGKYRDETCDLCETEEDSTEHLFNCEKLKSLLNKDTSLDALKDPTSKLSEYINQSMMIKNCVRLGGVGLGSRNMALSKKGKREGLSS